MEHADRQLAACCSGSSLQNCSGPARGERRRPSGVCRRYMPCHEWGNRRFLACAALCLLLVYLQAPSGEAVTPLTDWQNGIATNYGGPLDGKNPYNPSWGTITGSCGYGKLDKGQWPYWSVAALSSSNSFALKGPVTGCGQCFEVKCLDTAPFAGRCITGANAVSVIVQITDICPECAADHLDIQALTYNKLSAMDTGRINIQYRRVQCVPPKPMVISVDNNGGQGAWLRLFIEQAGGMAAVKSVQVRTSGSQDTFQSLTNKWGSDWETPNAPKFPLDINIVGADGESVTAYQVIQNSGATGKMPTQVQFKISDPGDQAITASASGGGSTSTAKGDSLSATVSTSPSSSSTSPSSGGDCSDTPPSSTYTCQQQKDFKACGQSWMSGYCKKTCGACSGGSPTSLQASGSPSNSPSWYSTYSSPAWAVTGSSPSKGSSSPSNSPSWYSTYSSPAWAETGSSPSKTSSSPSKGSNSPSWYSTYSSPAWAETGSSPSKGSNSPSWYSTYSSPAWAETGSSPSKGSPSWYSTYSSPAWASTGSSPSGRKLMAMAEQVHSAADGDAAADVDAVSSGMQA
ncbi:hypothetical protein CVIRNUC_010277 [Coccomyxa viridis]|uniref:Expansin-like EG45 domain-containing protein n=1 Tax=Coccomyxa viridis TaxID=1274662 RepID=A0AAV1IJQ6_9CHLO|nr:hypothetical protein CVIRNUC_010277 [Coccomyxa viridis]